MNTGPKPRSIQDAYKFIVDHKVEQNGCWLYTLGKKSVGIGYKLIRADGKDWYVHRLSFFINNGRLPKDGDVCRHTCHTPNCFNPDHLIEGSQPENIHDGVKQGRHQHGETHYRSKLTEDKVREIRKSSLSLQELSDKYGVSRGTIQQARDGYTWKHL